MFNTTHKTLDRRDMADSMELSSDVPPASAALTAEFVSQQSSSFDADPKLRLAQNAVTRSDVRDVLMRRDVSNSFNHHYSVKVAQECKVTDQKRTGRCWIFAALNVMRLGVMSKCNLTDDFELSQSYLFFWDKLEKCNYFLENVLLTKDKPLDGRLLQHLLKEPICDGGQWDMVTNLMGKYGVVPKSVFPESKTSMNSVWVNRFLTAKLREYALRLRGMAGKGAVEADLQKAKADMMAEVYKVLSVHFGAVPTPDSKFEWAMTDKHKAFKREEHTPLGFYRDLVSTKADQMVSIIHDPRNPYRRSYSVSYLGNVVGGDIVRYINLPIEELKRYAAATLDGGQPCWMGVDVFKSYHIELGILDTGMYDHDLVYGVSPGMTKEERLRSGESLMSHAMVFTGYDKRDGENIPNKWRVENSWGDTRGNKGYFLMTNAWFDEYLFQVVVNKSLLDKDLLPLLTDEPTMLPAWDPMGSLASVGRQEHQHQQEGGGGVGGGGGE
ncbi:unnamed protein product, partial [Ectocarpus fasciculatus]